MQFQSTQIVKSLLKKLKVRLECFFSCLRFFVLVWFIVIIIGIMLLISKFIEHMFMKLSSRLNVSCVSQAEKIITKLKFWPSVAWEFQMFHLEEQIFDHVKRSHKTCLGCFITFHAYQFSFFLALGRFCELSQSFGLQKNVYKIMILSFESLRVSFKFEGINLANVTFLTYKRAQSTPAAKQSSIWILKKVEKHARVLDTFITWWDWCLDSYKNFLNFPESANDFRMMLWISMRGF